MKGKQLAILLILVVALGGAWFFLARQNQASWSATGTGSGGKVIEFPINDVARLVIKNSAGELNLVKKGEVWTVQERADYPASFEQVSGLLRKLWDLKTVQEVKVGPSQMPRLELVEPGKGDSAGTLVQFIGADGKALGALLVGKKHLRKSEGGEMEFGGPGGGMPAGRYVKPLDGKKVSLVSETLDDVDVKPERWLSKDFIKIESPKSIAVAGPTEAQRWTVSRENATAEWKLAEAKPDEKLDTGKTSPLGSVFSSPSFNDVLAPDAKLEEPVTTATIETFDGFHYELKIGKANGENHPVLVKVSATFPKERTPGKDEKPEDKKRLDDEFAAKQKQFEEKLAKEKKAEGRAYVIPKFTVDPLLKERTALFPDKPAEPPKPAEPVTPPAPAPPIPIPGDSAATPPKPAPPAKIEVATPPVQAPPPPSAPPPANPAPAPPAPEKTPQPAPPPASSAPSPKP